MKCYAALRREDLDRLSDAKRKAEEEIERMEDKAFFARMETDPIFAELYQHDHRVLALLHV